MCSNAQQRRDRAAALAVCHGLRTHWTPYQGEQEHTRSLEDFDLSQTCEPGGPVLRAAGLAGINRFWRSLWSTTCIRVQWTTFSVTPPKNTTLFSIWTDDSILLAGQIACHGTNSPRPIPAASSQTNRKLLDSTDQARPPHPCAQPSCPPLRCLYPLQNLQPSWAPGKACQASLQNYQNLQRCSAVRHSHPQKAS